VITALTTFRAMAVRVKMTMIHIHSNCFFPSLDRR